MTFAGQTSVRTTRSPRSVFAQGSDRSRGSEASPSGSPNPKRVFAFTHTNTTRHQTTKGEVLTMDQIELAKLLASLANAGDSLHLNSMIARERTNLGGYSPLPSGHAIADWFLCELRKILSNASNRSVVSWLPEGKIWRIHDMMGFQALVLPQVLTFRKIHCPLNLFMAYTRVHGFQELSRGHNSVAFYNKVSILIAFILSVRDLLHVSNFSAFTRRHSSVNFRDIHQPLCMRFVCHVCP